MSTVTVSPLRQRMIEDMNARKLCAETQRGHIHSCRRFAAFLKQSPDTATAEDIRRFQLHLSETGVSTIPPPRSRWRVGTPLVRAPLDGPSVAPAPTPANPAPRLAPSRY